MREDLRLLPIVATFGSLVVIFMCSWPRLSLWQLSTPQPAICARRSHTYTSSRNCSLPPIVQHIHDDIKKKKKTKKRALYLLSGGLIGQVYERGEKGSLSGHGGKAS